MDLLKACKSSIGNDQFPMLPIPTVLGMNASGHNYLCRSRFTLSILVVFKETVIDTCIDPPVGIDNIDISLPGHLVEFAKPAGDRFVIGDQRVGAFDPFGIGEVDVYLFRSGAISRRPAPASGS